MSYVYISDVECLKFQGRQKLTVNFLAKGQQGEIWNIPHLRYKHSSYLALKLPLDKTFPNDTYVA